MNRKCGKSLEELVPGGFQDGFTRREFLKLGAGLPLLAAARDPLSTVHRVGVARGTEPYESAVRAIDASGDWDSLSLEGRFVVIKPNIVLGVTSDTGVVTDPEVVRAVVDKALAGGAAGVLIVETAGATGAHFDAAGYGFFRSYDPEGRVLLVDLRELSEIDAPVPAGWLYESIRAPALILSRRLVFINVAKLKTHQETVASLCTKNVFGIPSVTSYISTPPIGRFAMHDRGVNQAIIDINLLRPSDFCVIDGIWAMEGQGPLLGTPLRAEIVLAARNAVAVDRVALTAMDIPQIAVKHLAYASFKGLGPWLNQITVHGDAIEPLHFERAVAPPQFSVPSVTPRWFSPPAGETVSIRVSFQSPCLRTIDVLRVSDLDPTVEHIRTLIPMSGRSSGSDTILWNGRYDDGTLVSRGRYAVHVRAYEPTLTTHHGDATSYVDVV